MITSSEEDGIARDRSRELSRALVNAAVVILATVTVWRAVGAEARTSVPRPESPSRGPGSIYAIRAPYLFSHDAGSITCQITNMGLIGNPYVNLISLGWQDGEYLFADDLWVGAVGEDGQPRVSTGLPQELRPDLDPRDTIYGSFEGVTSGTRPGEPHADDDGDGAIDEDFQNGRDDDGDGAIDEDFEAISPEMLSCEYRDNTPEAVSQVPGHVPMDIRVSQRSFAWSRPPYTQFIGFDYMVTNIGNQRLRDVFIGFLVDGDVGPAAHDQYWADDLATFIALDTMVVDTVGAGAERRVALDIACMYDAPDGGPWNGGDVAGYMGALFLNHPTDPSGLEAPAEVGLHTVRFLAVPAGPATDQERYDLLGSGIRDQNVPNPGDYRMLISAGPFAELDPGESISFQTALAIGAGRSGLIDQVVDLERLFHGVTVDADDDPQTGVDGREYRLHWAIADSVTPVAFQTLAAGVENGGIRVSFRAASDQRIAGADVERRDPGLPDAWKTLTPEIIPVAADGRGSWLDTTPVPGRRYGYRVVLHHADGAVTRSSEIEVEMMSRPGESHTRLHNPHPNPSSREFWIPFAVADDDGAAKLRLDIVDAAGRRVRHLFEGLHPPGSGAVVWDGMDDSGRPVAGGVYFAVLGSAEGNEVRRIVVRK